MPRHPEVLADITNAVADFVLQSPQPQNIPGTSSSRAIYLHRISQEKWLAKSPACQPDRPSAAPDIKQQLLFQAKTRRLLLKEKIANDIYAYYGVAVPRIAMADLPCHYFGYDAEIALGLLGQAPHLLSRWLDRFTEYSYLPSFNNAATMELAVGDQLLAEQGLGHILAVAHFLYDTDVIGGSGKNIGYKLSLTPAGKVYAHSCKIDPGQAFFKYKQVASREVSRQIQIASVVCPQHLIDFNRLAKTTQQEFLQTLRDIIETPAADIERFFRRKGAEDLEKNGFIAQVIPFLRARQNNLAKVFQLELATRQTVKDAKTSSTFAEKLPAELRIIYAHVVFAQTDPIAQQAQHFYIEPHTTLDGESESEKLIFSQMIEEFIASREAKLLLLLGDSGFGKSTTSQHLLHQQWQRYLVDPKNSRISFRIELQQFSERTVGLCVDNFLMDNYRLTAKQIAALKQQPCLIILDGFDEIEGRIKLNLWQTNKLNEWRDLRVVITCRSLYVNYLDIQRYFYPDGQVQSFRQRYLAPFSPQQIANYLQKAPGETPHSKLKTSLSFAPKTSAFSAPTTPSILVPSKTISQLDPSLFGGPSDTYFLLQPIIPPEEKKGVSPAEDPEDGIIQQLAESAHLQQLLQIPLLLKIFSDALPCLQQQEQDLTQLNRYVLYDTFMRQWFERNRARLSQNLGTLLNPTQCQKFLDYSHNLASALFKAKAVQIEYTVAPSAWDRFFSQSDAETINLRSGCPLRRAGNSFGFIHRSFYEFFLAQHIVQLLTSSADNIPACIKLLNLRNLREELPVLAFLQQAYQSNNLNRLHVNKLFAIISRSADEPQIAIASANAASILTSCQVPLNDQSWQAVQLAGADLSYSVLAGSDLRRANLQGAILTAAMLYQVHLDGADLRDVEWGILPPSKFCIEFPLSHNILSKPVLPSINRMGLCLLI